MLSCLRLGAIAAVSLAVLGPSSVAQDVAKLGEPWFNELLAGLRVDEITADSGQVVVRASLPKADGGTEADAVFICSRGDPELDMFGWVDKKLKTDNRIGVQRGACDALLAFARRRRYAQGK